MNFVEAVFAEMDRQQVDSRTRKIAVSVLQLTAQFMDQGMTGRAAFEKAVHTAARS